MSLAEKFGKQPADSTTELTPRAAATVTPFTDLDGPFLYKYAHKAKGTEHLKRDHHVPDQ